MLVIGKVYWVKDSVVINTVFNTANNKYVLTVGNVSLEDSSSLEKEFGIKTKEGKEDQGLVFTAKSLYKFVFKDEAGKEIDPISIANGSDVVVNVTSSYDHAFAKRYGKGASVFKEVVVTNIVERT